MKTVSLRLLTLQTSRGIIFDSSLRWYCWVINKDHEDKGNDCQPKKFWLLDEFSLSIPKECKEKSMESIDTDVRV